MADERNNYEAAASVESTDRGLFDFMKKKKNDEEECKTSEAGIGSGIEKVHVSEPDQCRKEEDEVKHGSLLEKLHRSDSSTSSSSDEEGDDEEKKKRRKERKEKKAGLKEKIHEKLHKKDDDCHEDTNVPIEKVHVAESVYSEPSYPAPAAQLDHHHQEEEEKKGGLLDKIKDKLHKDKADDHEVVAPVAAPVVAEPCVEEEKEKKGFLDKIKEKIPGFHSKNDAEEKKDHDQKY